MPRTGIEYPFTKERRQFISAHKEFERLADTPASSALFEQYQSNDIERANTPLGIHPIVYDSLEMSPFYDAEDPND